MKKMLFITPRILFPTTSGGLIGSLTSLKFLAKKYNLDFITFVEKKSVNLDNIEKNLKSNNVKNIFLVDFKLKKRSIWNIISAIIFNIPLSIYRNKSTAMKKKIAEIANDYDYIYADHWLTMQYIPKNYKGKVILKEHNAEYIMWERLITQEKNIIKKFYLQFETARIKKYEAAICNSADYIITVTDEDKKNLTIIGAKSDKIKMLPAIIVDNIKHPIDNFEERKNSLMYVGSLSWDANIDGLKYFLKNIYPKVKVKNPDIKFYIIGKTPPEVLQQFAKKDNSIILTGFVDDLTEYYEKCKLFIVYLRYGSGIKIKILEALANAMPVITNDIGMEGILTQGATLANEDNEFADKILSLLNNNDELKIMSKEGIKYISKNYSKKSYQDYYDNIDKETK